MLLNTDDLIRRSAWNATTERDACSIDYIHISLPGTLAALSRACIDTLSWAGGRECGLILCDRILAVQERVQEMSACYQTRTRTQHVVERG